MPAISSRVDSAATAYPAVIGATPAAIPAAAVAGRFERRAFLGGACEDVVPVSALVPERFDEPLERSRDVVVGHRYTSVIASLTFR